MKLSLKGLFGDSSPTHSHEWIYDDNEYRRHAEYRTCVKCGMRQKKDVSSGWLTVRKDWLMHGGTNSQALMMIKMLGIVVQSPTFNPDDKRMEWKFTLKHPEFLKNKDAMEHPEKYMELVEDDERQSEDTVRE